MPPGQSALLMQPEPASDPPLHLIDEGVRWVEQAQGKQDHFSILMFGQVFERMQFL